MRKRYMYLFGCYWMKSQIVYLCKETTNRKKPATCLNPIKQTRMASKTNMKKFTFFSYFFIFKLYPDRLKHKTV